VVVLFGITPTLPAVAVLEVQEAAQLVAFVELQERNAVPPAEICAGLAPILTVGAGIGGWTVTVTGMLVHPPGPRQSTP
jgi:hypothetical protein